MRIGGVLLTALIEFFYLQRWLLCEKLADKFHYSAFDLKLRIEEAVHNDGGIPLTIVRAYHNKVLGTILDGYTHLLHYFDILFLLPLLSPVGAFGFFLGVFYAFKYFRTRYFILLLILLVIFPLIEILYHPYFYFPVKIMVMATPYVFVSLLGVRYFLSEKKNKRLRFIMVLFLILVSIGWYFTFPDQLKDQCFLHNVTEIIKK